MYSDFLKKYRLKLIDVGIPVETIENENKFDYLIEHGYCYYTNWNTDSLNFRQIKLLNGIVKNYLNEHNLSDVLGYDLRNKMHLIEKKLDILQYTFDWIDFEILSLKELDNQISVYNLGKDCNTEHYRYKTFKNYINQNESFTTLQIENIISLALKDNDKAMSSSVLVELLRKELLTEEQTEKMITALKSYGNWTETVIERINKIKTGYNNGYK